MASAQILSVLHKKNVSRKRPAGTGCKVCSGLSATISQLAKRSLSVGRVFQNWLYGGAIRFGMTARLDAWTLNVTCDQNRGLAGDGAFPSFAQP